MTLRILAEKTPLADLKKLSEETYAFMLKGSVDIGQKRVAAGGDYHIESCEELVRSGSRHEDIWGFNIVFTDDGYYLEYDSLINIKPAKNNRSRIISDKTLQKKLGEIIARHIA